MADHLTVEWIDPRGITWNLTEGTEGVLLDVGQSDFHRAPITHTYVRGGSQWAASRIERAEPSLKVLVADGKTGADYYQLADEWWSLANSHHLTGTLRVTRPDGEVRELVCRLRDTPATEWEFDPGSGIKDNPGEPWLLTSESSYWQGPEQSVRFDQSAVEVGATPFYGEDGTGWPLHIAPINSAKNLYVSNAGQGPQWLTWTLTGPLSSPQFGVQDGILSYNGTIAAGETVIVSTAPGDRWAMEAGTGENRYGRITGTYAPLPVGEQLPVTISAEGMTSASAVVMTAREQYVKPF